MGEKKNSSLIKNIPPARLITAGMMFAALLLVGWMCWPEETHYNIRLTNEAGASVRPDIVASSSDGYGAVWADSRNGEDQEIYFKTISGDGFRLGRDTQLSLASAPATSTYIADNPKIAWDSGRNNFSVLWEEYSRNQADNETLGCFLKLKPLASSCQAGPPNNPIKNIVWDNFGSCPSNARLIYKGGYTEFKYGVFWNESRRDTPTSRVYMLPLRDCGNASNYNAVRLTATSSVLIDAEWGPNEYGVLWRTLPNSQPEKTYFTRFNEVGNRIGPDMVIQLTASSTAKMAWDMVYNYYDQDYGIFWQGYDENYIKQQYFMKINRYGSIIIPGVQITPNLSPDYAMVPGEAVWANKEYAVALQSKDLLTGRNIIQMMKVGRNGETNSTSTIRISDFTRQGEGRDPQITWQYDPALQPGIVWMDTRDNNNGEEIYFSTGTPVMAR